MVDSVVNPPNFRTIGAASSDPMYLLICKKTIKSQKEDEKCCEIVHTVEHGGNCGNFVFANGLLYKETGGDKRIYVPRSMEVVASSNIALSFANLKLKHLFS